MTRRDFFKTVSLAAAALSAPLTFAATEAKQAPKKDSPAGFIGPWELTVNPIQEEITDHQGSTAAMIILGYNLRLTVRKAFAVPYDVMPLGTSLTTEQLFAGFPGKTIGLIKTLNVEKWRLESWDGLINKTDTEATLHFTATVTGIES
jgi:hypothetical protein